MLELGNFVCGRYSPKGAKQNMEEGEGGGRRPHLHESRGHPKTGQSERTFVDAEVSINLIILITHEVTDPHDDCLFQFSPKLAGQFFSRQKLRQRGP